MLFFFQRQQQLTLLSSYFLLSIEGWSLLGIPPLPPFLPLSFSAKKLLYYYHRFFFLEHIIKIFFFCEIAAYP